MSPDLKVHKSKVLGLLILPVLSKEIEIKPALRCTMEVSIEVISFQFNNFARLTAAKAHQY